MIPEQSLIGFLLFLIVKREIKLLPKIFQKFRTLILDYRQQIEATLTTAVPVDSHALIQLQNRLNATFQKKSIVIPILDPSIIAGAILILDNRMADYSLKGRLDRLKKSLCLPIGP